MLRNRFRNDKEEQATWVFWMVACCWKHRSAWRFYLFLQVGAAAQPFFKLFVYILSGWPVGSCWYLDPRSPMNSNLSADFRLRRRMGELAERQDGQSVSAKCCHLAKKSLRLEKWREIQHEKKKRGGCRGCWLFLRFFVEGQECQEATRIKPVELPVFGMLQELPEAFQSQGRKRSILHPAHEVTTVSFFVEHAKNLPYAFRATYEDRTTPRRFIHAIHIYMYMYI